MNAILTADIVKSTVMPQKAFEDLINKLKAFFINEQQDFFNGDSFRVLIADPNEALLKCIKSRLIAIQYTVNEQIDIRISINIGTLKTKKIDLRSSMDDLLVTSGRSFAKLQDTSKRLFITADNKEKDFTYSIIAEYTDSLIGQLTAKQAKVLFELLSGKSQVETAALLKLSTATVSKQLKAARYDELKSMLVKFEILTTQLKNGN
ncbi:helix-turn-helix transcriptional regulator [Mucilaginibacter sp.]|uniref:helix-turn-helix transcriptional regulator n=1 Tax=Mucilaginibacter sp. TaxID=1882438 RepID=UPI0035BC62EC